MGNHTSPKTMTATLQESYCFKSIQNDTLLKQRKMASDSIRGFSNIRNRIPLKLSNLLVVTINRFLLFYKLEHYVILESLIRKG